MGKAVVLFAGAGGSCTGIEAAIGRKIDDAVNHDALALAVHKANHPHTKHHVTDVWDVDPRVVAGKQEIDILWASPDCTHFSVAKGGKPKNQKIRSLAWVVVRWARALPPHQRPKVMFVENVSEFQKWGPLDGDGKPKKEMIGFTFRNWCAQLRNLGYTIDFRVMDASVYGAPTRRKRLFIVARCDGNPVEWPKPTHGPGLQPLHTAAECIDWNIPAPSIFNRKRALAPKTMWRIFQGLKKFVIDSADPFIVEMNHSNAPRSVDDPLGTITTQGNRFNLVSPVMATVDNGSQKHGGFSGPQAPLPTTTTENRHAVVAPHLVKVNHGKQQPRGEAIDRPLSTITAKRRGHALVTPHLLKFRFNKDGADLRQPMPTITAGSSREGRPAGAGHALGLALPTLVQVGYGERKGQAARVPGLHKPLGTIVAGGRKHGLVSAYVTRNFGGDREGMSTDPRKPLPTVTAKDHKSKVAVTMLKMRGDCHGGDPRDPMPTVTAKGFHIGEVRAFLTAFYGSDNSPGKGQDLRNPMRTITSKSRLGLVTVRGELYQIVDIGMRMLTPEELLRAQFGKYAAHYDLSLAKTKADKVRLIGNSVCPEHSEALVRANLPKTRKATKVA